MTTHRAIPTPESESESEDAPDPQGSLEGAFRRQLHAELVGQGTRPMADVVARATGRGRRRVRVRAGGVAVSVVATVAVLGLAATVAVERGDVEPRRAAAPATSTLPDPGPRTADARDTIARELGEALVDLLPVGGTKSPIRTGYSPDNGLSAELTWDSGPGPAGVSVSLRTGGPTVCAGGEQVPDRTDDQGRTYSLKCVGAPRSGTRFGVETIRRDGVPWGQALQIPIGPSVLRLFWANGPLDGRPVTDAKGRMPLTDDQALAIARNPRWESIARTLRDAGPGAG
ncbi:hypothetical protein [Embleya sp. AB8]|uniref:hypothetical protein n=1 Tax=Embleya sp. AB8 TaxID=3156304 RepID=UPI003C7724D7